VTETKNSPVGLWEAAERELKEYQFVSDLTTQPRWDIPTKMALNVAVAGRFSQDKGTHHPTSIEEFLSGAGDVIDRVPPAFTWTSAFCTTTQATGSI